MTAKLILIANATEARFFTRKSETDPLVFMETLQHPEGRVKPSELGDDRPGHGSSDQRPGGVSFTPRTDPRRKMHMQFARRLADRVDELLAEDRSTGIELFASSPFLGELKAELSPAAQKVLRVTVDVDLTSVPVGELGARMKEALGQRGGDPKEG